MSEILAIKNGDKAAFENVYGRLHVKLFRYLLNRTRSEDIAREVTQQTFIRLWLARHTLSEAYSIDTQLFTIAKSTLLNYLRKQSLERKYFTGPVDPDNLQKSFVQPSEDLFTPHPFESNNYWQTAVECLPPVRKKVFLLSRVHGLSNKEIALQLSISVKTVEDHISKAIRHLRSLTTLLGLLPFIYHPLH